MLAFGVLTRAAWTVLLRLGRTLSLGRRFVVLNAVRRSRILGGMLPSHVNAQAVPRVEGLTTMFVAGALEHVLHCSGRRGAPDVAQMFAKTSASEEPFAVGALHVSRRFPHLLSDLRRDRELAQRRLRCIRLRSASIKRMSLDLPA